MGLAASQARFLGITARKNHCELKSMQIAQEKLSVTNQLSQISEDYQRSLDATKLVWDSELITDGSIYDVSYELLMQPSYLNDYSPQLLTNNHNQIVVNNQMAIALKAAGLAETGGSPRNQTTFEKFIAALNTAGIINTAEAAGISANKSLYKDTNGLGGEVMETFSTNEMNLGQMKKFINAITNEKSTYMTGLAEQYKGSADPNSPYKKALSLGKVLNFKMPDTTTIYTNSLREEDKITGPTFSEWISNKGGYTIDGSGNKQPTLKGTTSITQSKFNFADLLANDITFSSTGDATTRDADVKKVLEQFINLMYNVMSQFFELDPNSVDKTYLTFAMFKTCDLVGLKWDSTSNQVDSAGSTGFPRYINTSDLASAHTGIVVSGNKLSVSLSNIAKNIMTYFQAAVEGYNSGYSVQSTEKQLVNSSNYVTKDPTYKYFVKNPSALGSTDSDTFLLLNYYSQMFNQICTNGWTENAVVDDPEMLKNMLKNGTLFTSTLADDGMFYQGAYTSNNFIAEVADEDAIARAEADFKIKQAKLNALEERLNVDMQMVDAELSALTTEYDTVKQMISKGIEKGFSTLGGG